MRFSVSLAGRIAVPLVPGRVALLAGHARPQVAGALGQRLGHRIGILGFDADDLDLVGFARAIGIRSLARLHAMSRPAT